MKMIVSVLACLFSVLTNASVLTFDDVATSTSFDGNTYYEWVLDEAAIVDGWWPAASVSGDNYITNYNSRVGTLSRADSFDFVGAYFTSDGRYSEAEGLELLVSGLDDIGNTVFSEIVILSTAAQFFAFNWDGIYGVSWDPLSPSSNNIGVDDFTFTVASVSEPSTIAVFALALAFVFARKRRAIKAS